MDNILIEEDNIRQKLFGCSRFDNNSICPDCNEKFSEYDELNCVPSARRFNFETIHNKCLLKRLTDNSNKIHIKKKLNNSKSPCFIYMEVKIDKCDDFEVDDIIYNVKNKYIMILLTEDEFFVDDDLDNGHTFIGGDEYNMYLNNDEYAILRKYGIRLNMIKNIG